ncbi:hypothetical protein BC940DRAFT_116481 [Gongronella butleri]|nr:hypothetical protein BC940DRAFT_116481 [Gongronella butleri]
MQEGDTANFMFLSFDDSDLTQVPGYFYVHNKASVVVYQRTQENGDVERVRLTTTDLATLADTPDLTIVSVLDTAYKRQPALLVLMRHNDQLHLFWHAFEDNVTRKLVFDEPLTGAVLHAALTTQPISLVRNSTKEVLDQTNLRYLLVLAQKDLQLTAIVIDPELVVAGGASMGVIMRSDWSSKVSGQFSALQVLSQSRHVDRRFYMMADPPIVFGTTKGRVVKLRLHARVGSMKLVPVKVVRKMSLHGLQRDEPITLLSCMRVPKHGDTLVAIGQDTPRTPTVRRKFAAGRNGYLRVIEKFGNNQQKLMDRFVPTHLPSFTQVAVRLVPNYGSYQVMAIFQSLDDPHQFELDIWRCKHGEQTQLLAELRTEPAGRHVFQDMWPTTAGGYLLLHGRTVVDSQPVDDVHDNVSLPPSPTTAMNEAPWMTPSPATAAATPNDDHEDHAMWTIDSTTSVESIDKLSSHEDAHIDDDDHVDTGFDMDFDNLADEMPAQPANDAPAMSPSPSSPPPPPTSPPQIAIVSKTALLMTAPAEPPLSALNDTAKRARDDSPCAVGQESVKRSKPNPLSAPSFTEKKPSPLYQLGLQFGSEVLRRFVINTQKP